jgi:hypothetical protein
VTISAIVKRHRVVGPPAIQTEDMPHLIRLYNDESSLARLGAEVGCDAGLQAAGRCE